MQILKKFPHGVPEILRSNTGMAYKIGQPDRGWTETQPENMAIVGIAT